MSSNIHGPSSVLALDRCHLEAGLAGSSSRGVQSAFRPVTGNRLCKKASYLLLWRRILHISLRRTVVLLLWRRAAAAVVVLRLAALLVGHVAWSCFEKSLNGAVA